MGRPGAYSEEVWMRRGRPWRRIYGLVTEQKQDYCLPASVADDDRPKGHQQKGDD